MKHRLFTKSHIILFATLLFSISVNSQAVQDTTIASQHFNKANTLLKEIKPDSSIIYYKKALLLYQKAETWQKVASCYNRISECQWRTQKQEKSLKNSKKALEICRKHLSENHIETANGYNNIGTYYENAPNYKKALVNYEKALSIRLKIFPKDHPSIAESYNKKAIIYYYTANYIEALKLHKKALSIKQKAFGPDHTRTAASYNNIGIVYKALGSYKKAIEYIKKFLESTIKNYGKNHAYVGYSHINIGAIYVDLNQHENALAHLDMAIPIFTKKNNTYGLSKVYTNMGIAFENKGEYDNALRYYNKGADLNFKLYGETNLSTAISYENIGILYQSMENNRKALEFLNRALEIYKVIQGENQNSVALIYDHIGTIYTDQKSYDIALEYFKKSISIRKTVFGENNPKTTESFIPIANFYLERGDYDTAIKYQQDRLKVLQDNYGKDHLITSEVYNILATIYQKKEEYNKAITYCDKALLACNVNNEFQNLENGNTFDPNKYYNLRLLMNILSTKARTLKFQYLASKEIKYLEQSLEIYQSLDKIIDLVRKSYQNYHDKMSFAKNAKEVYKDAIYSEQLFYKKTKKQSALEKIFYYSEKSKANTLKELLNDSYAKDFSNIRKELIETEAILKTNLAFYQSQIIDKQSETSVDTNRIRRYENKLFDISRKQDSLTKILEEKYPKYYQLKHNNSIISISKIQKKLGNQTTLLEFFITDSISYAFIISKSKISVKELFIPDLQYQIKKIRSTITDKKLKNFKTTSYHLYKKLIDPIKDQIEGKELIIVPDGPLWHLNFDLLLTKDDDSSNPKLLSYFLNDYAISYANSANLLFNSFKSDQKSKKMEECLAFSFTDSSNIANSKTISLATLRDSGDDLPGTRKEIKAISNIVQGQYYYGSEAIEANFKKNADKYNILHLALHGEVDNEHPENSRLFFTKSKDTIEDDFLYSHELFALDLPAELTVLSACNTGTGKIAKGEGIMSLGNAFQYAGTKSLLLTSWEVSDQTTPKLMEYFYSNLKKGMNKAKALQQAKLQYLNTAAANRTNPFYWGGFYLIGNSAPINFSNNNLSYLIFGLGGIGIILLSLFWYKKKTKK